MTHTDPSADAFMRCILANPADAVPRLVFADWLEESGTSSNLAWARYLRLADELATAPADDPRKPKMADELDRVGSLVRAKLTYRAEVFVAYPDAMRQVLPLRNMVLNLDTLMLPQRVVELLPASLAFNRSVLPLTECGSGLAFAVPDPDHSDIGELLRFALNRDVVLLRASPDRLRSAVERHYEPVEYLDHGFPHPFTAEPATLVDRTPLTIRAVTDDTPIRRLIDLLLGEAIRLRATALEIEPRLEQAAVQAHVWYHFQGERRPRDAFPTRLLPAVTARLRLMADIFPVLHPVQSGTIPLLHRGRSYRLPVRITATPNGPHIHVTIPPTPADPPAAVVNPAA
jgi:uncharacterized protein (TIGR02996 family)